MDKSSFCHCWLNEVDGSCKKIFFSFLMAQWDVLSHIGTKNSSNENMWLCFGSLSLLTNGSVICWIHISEEEGCLLWKFLALASCASWTFSLLCGELPGGSACTAAEPSETTIPADLRKDITHGWWIKYSDNVSVLLIPHTPFTTLSHMC